MVELKDIAVEGSAYKQSLSKLIGKPIQDIHGYISQEFDSPAFKLSCIVFADGTKLDVEGEHDFPYLTNPFEAQPNYDGGTLVRLYDEMNNPTSG